MSSIPVAVQLYSVREAFAQDAVGTLQQVARMGYAGVEFAGYAGLSARELRRLLEDCGLAVAGTHLPIDSLLGDEFERTVEFNRTLGNRFLIVPWLPDDWRASRAAWQRTAERFNAIAERLAPHGMYVGYHNHHVEFTPLDGETFWEVLFRSTVPSVVMQGDTGNALRAGVDVTSMFARFPGRALTVHLKEYARDKPLALLGEGEVDWPQVFRACETVGGTQWYIVEQEAYPCPPLESIARCREALRRMGR